MIGHLITGQKIFQFVGLRRPAMANDTDTGKGRLIVGLPIFEQIVKDRVEFFLGRRPRLEQVIMDRGCINGINGGIRVCIGG